MFEQVSNSWHKRLIGQTFGDYTVVEFSHIYNKRCYWLSRCSCGKEKIRSSITFVRSDNLCDHTYVYKPRRPYGRRKKWKYTSISHTSEYLALRNAFDRCRRETHFQYADYGGRGITVHEDWDTMAGFQRFMAHIGPKPSPDHSLDRIDNDGNYEPGNVRWATRAQQLENRRCSK